MADPLDEVDETLPALHQVLEAAGPFLDSLPTRLVYDRSAVRRCSRNCVARCRRQAWARRRPCRLCCAWVRPPRPPPPAALLPLRHRRPTPAAIAADWASPLLDQNAFARVSRLATRRDGRAATGCGTCSGCRPAGAGRWWPAPPSRNFTGLDCATHWWGGRHGVDVPPTAWPGCPGCRCSRRLRARQRPQGAADAGARPGHRRGVRRDAVGRVDLRRWAAARRARRRARRPRSPRRRGQRRRLRPDRRPRGPRRARTAPGCTWMARSGSSPRCPRAPRT